MAAGSAWRGVLLLAAIFAVYAYPTHAFNRYRNVNETCRIYQVEALVRERALHIDSGIARYGDLQDKAQRGGHAYCDKPIGLALAAVPVYALLCGAERIGGWEGSLQQTRYLLTLACVILPSVGLLFLLRRYWIEVTGERWLAEFSVAAYGLGTIAAVYATQFMGHQLSAVLVFAHFMLSRGFRRSDAPVSALFLAGLLAGFGAITQYFSAFAHAAIALSYLPRAGVARAAGFVAGGVIGVAPLLAYNAAAFGGPFEMAYGHEAIPEYAEQHGKGFFGVTAPAGEAFTGLLFSPAKGLFFLSPFLLFGLVGIPVAIAEPRRRRDAIVMAICIVAIAWLAMSVVGWRAGWTVGPRHMVDLLPMLMTGVVIAVARFPVLRAYYVALALLGIVFVVPTMLTLPAFAIHFENPLVDQTLFLLREGVVSPNLGSLAGIPPLASLAVPGALVLAALVSTRREWEPRRPRPHVAHAFAAGALAAALLGLVLRAEPSSRAVVWLVQGTVLEQLDRESDAAAWLERARDADRSPQIAERASLALLRIHQRRQDLAGAVRTVDRWIEIDPGSAQAQGARAQLRAIEQRSGRTP